MSAETPESREGQAPTGPVATAQPTSGGTNGGAPHAPGHAHAHHSTIEFRFLQQLKQRNVIRVGILYLVVCWLILDPVHVLFHMLEVPLWANRLVVILMAMGFPALLLFAWAYEITPEGLKPTTEVDPHRSIRRQTGQRLNRAIVVGLVLAVAYLLADKFWLSKQQLVTEQSTDRLIASPASGVPAIPDKSIAVLPFTDMSEKNDQEYFADGMAEEMVDILAKIPQLKVIGRISSFYFKGQAEDLPTIGEKLGAAYILRGSVRRGGPQIRVTAQLFEARSGAQLWAESYDREFGDVLALQDQIASNIARALQLAVVMDDAQELRRLKSPEAYALYLRGRSAYDRGEGGLREAQVNFEQVLALEPKFPRAAEALALTHLALIGDYMVSPRIGWQNAVDAANVALRLNPKSALAHAILGLKLAMYDYDWAGAEQELERALAAESRDPVVLYNCSWLAFDVGRVDEALHFQDAALSLDPLNPDSLQNGAIIHYLLGHFALAERGFRKGLKISPTFGGNHKYLGQILLLQGRPREALQEMEAEGRSDRDIGLALVYHALGQRVASDIALDRAKNSGELSEVSIATVYAYRGEIDQAFDWLGKAVAARDGALGHKLEHDPLLAPLRSDPRYLRLLRDVHLKE
jgi:TolB-like protein/Tfp pilus assembly protein PilF